MILIIQNLPPFILLIFLKILFKLSRQIAIVMIRKKIVEAVVQEFNSLTLIPIAFFF